MGKTYTCTAYLILDWLADVEFTACRIVSVTGGHALEQAFSAMQNAVSRINSAIAWRVTKRLYWDLDKREAC